MPRLLKCTCNNGNNWIKLKLVGTKSNRSAIGARVRCVSGNHRQIDEVRSGGSHFSQSDLRIHFGLGNAERVDLLEISWPSGRLDRLKDVPANQIMTLREGQQRVTRERFSLGRIGSSLTILGGSGQPSGRTWPTLSDVYPLSQP